MRRWMLLPLLLAYLLSACASRGPLAEPQGMREGYYAVDQVVNGGQSGTSASLASIEIGEDEDGVWVFFGLENERGGKASALPPYIVWMQPTPDRLTLQISGLFDWDWESAPPAPNALVYGAFARYMEQPDDPSFSVAILTLNLSAPCEYRVEERDGGLRILLSPSLNTPEANETYHVILSSHLQAVIEPADVMSMTLCADGAARALISMSFEDREAAGAKAEGLRKRLNMTEADRELEVIALPYGTLPPAPGFTPAEHFAERPMLKHADGITDNGQLLSSDMRFLCWLDAERALMTKARPDGVTDNLYIKERSGSTALFLPYELGSVQSALPSPDKSMVALYATAGDVMALYLTDRVTGAFTRIDAAPSQGTNQAVLSYVWGPDGMLYYLLYTWTDDDGGSDIAELWAYDPEASPDDPDAARALLGRYSGVYDAISVFDGSVVMTRSEEDQAPETLAVNLATLELKVLAHGFSALASDDARFLAVGEASDGDDWEGVIDILNVYAGDSAPITVFEGNPVYDVAWSPGGALWWASLAEGEYGEPLVQLWLWTQADGTVYMGQIYHGTIMPGVADDELVLSDVVELGGAWYDAAWIVQFK